MGGWFRLVEENEKFYDGNMYDDDTDDVLGTMELFWARHGTVFLRDVAMIISAVVSYVVSWIVTRVVGVEVNPAWCTSLLCAAGVCIGWYALPPLYRLRDKRSW